MPIITVTNQNDSGAGSLRDAIARSQSGDTIAFASSLANQTITLTSGQLTVNPGRTLTIDGASASNLTISGNNASRIFYVNSNQDFPINLTIKNLKLANGYTSEQGGAAYVTHRGELTVENVSFNNNVADNGGGAIYTAYETNLTVNGSRFDGNKAIAGNDERGAGAIAFFGPGALTVRDSDFTNNRGINGAAINSLNGRLSIENSRFINNDTNAAVFATGKPNDFLRGYGGAIYTDRANDTIVIKNSVFEGNTSRAAGGAVHLFNDPEDTVTIESSLFKDNRATGLPGGEGGNAGAITQVRNSLDSRGSFTLRNTSLVNNTAGSQGGGLWMNNSYTTVTNSTFSGNRVLGTDYSNIGGGMALYGPTTIVNTTLANNRAGWVGGGISANESPVTVKNTIFFNNTADNGTNNWGIQQHTSRELTDNGGNIQYPPKRTTNWNDYNATATITLADPKLGDLQTIGGALVHPLLSGSPAINAGVAGAPTTDERGVTRDSQPDIGAYEYSGTVALSSSFKINDVTLTEGNSGTTNAIFSVTRSGATSQIATVNYATANGTATGSDYTAKTGTLTFNAGETTKTLAIPVIGDTLVEPNETFFVNLSNPTNATIADAQGIGTITNNDTAPSTASLAINDITVTEGNSGSKNATFTVTRSGATSGIATVNYATANGTATAGSDYTAKTGSLTFNAGETSKTIAIAIQGNTIYEPTETFSVKLSGATNATISDGTGVGTIQNDDRPALTITNVSLNEGNSGTTNAGFTVKLSGVSSQKVTVRYATANNSAIAGSDYKSLSGSLSFNPGETSKRINVQVIGDKSLEANESFYVNLSSATNATISGGRGVGTIRNDDSSTQSLTTSAARSTVSRLDQPNGAGGQWFASSLPISRDTIDPQATKLSTATNPDWTLIRSQLV